MHKPRNTGNIIWTENRNYHEKEEKKYLSFVAKGKKVSSGFCVKPNNMLRIAYTYNFGGAVVMRMSWSISSTIAIGKKIVNINPRAKSNEKKRSQCWFVTNSHAWIRCWLFGATAVVVMLLIWKSVHFYEYYNKAFFAMLIQAIWLE